MEAPDFLSHSDRVNGARWLDFRSGGGDGIANNGVFDLFLSVQAESKVPSFCSSGIVPAQSYSGTYEEWVVHFGTLESGDSFYAC